MRIALNAGGEQISRVKGGCCGTQLGVCCSEFYLNQVSDGIGGQWLDSGYVLKIELMRLADGPNQLMYQKESSTV